MGDIVASLLTIGQPLVNAGHAAPSLVVALARGMAMGAAAKHRSYRFGPGGGRNQWSAEDKSRAANSI